MPDHSQAPLDQPGGLVARERRFGDEAVARILKRAADLHDQQGLAGGPGGGTGLTVSELRAIASEAGIDPRFIDQAVADVGLGGDGSSNPIAGAPVAWSFRRVIPGEVHGVDRDAILQAIRSVLGHKGEISDVYGRMEWSYDDGLGPIIVGVASRDGETVIDVSARRASEVGLFMGLGVPMGGALGGAALLGISGLSGPVFALPMIGAVAAACFVGGRFGWRWLSKRWERKMLTLTDAVASAAQSVAELPPVGEDGEG